MCEIAVFDPERSNKQLVQQTAGVFYREQEDGLGVVATIDHGDRFEHRAYKSTDPHWKTLHDFLTRAWDEAYRITVHARNGTSGAKNWKTVHPIEVDCECTGFDYVVHNGHVKGHIGKRNRMEKEGHTFNTGVDSEIIAHKVGHIPEKVDDLSRQTYTFRGNLNYLLYSERGIFVHVDQLYHLDDEFRMTCRPDELGPFEHGNDTEWMIVRPGGEIESKERQVWYANSSTGTTLATRRYSGTITTTTTSRSSTGSRKSPPPTKTSSGDTHTIEYEDLIPMTDKVVALKVAPGVVRLQNEVDDNIAYIYEHEDPETYYFYTDEEPEEATDDDSGEEDEQDEVDDPEEVAARESERQTVRNIAAVEGISMSEAEDIAEGLDYIAG